MIYPVIEQKIREQDKTVLDLSREIGVPKSTLYAKLAGESEIGMRLALKIKTALNADEPIEQLFAPSNQPGNGLSA